jgi:hypothetical protein
MSSTTVKVPKQLSKEDIKALVSAFYWYSIIKVSEHRFITDSDCWSASRERAKDDKASIYDSGGNLLITFEE